MSSPGPGFLRQAWFKWKSLRLPWRKQFWVGSDLSGTTFWEFRDDIRAGRWRRIAKYPTSMHHADVKLSPQWIQWLRHTRHEAPSIQEQQYEVSRQAMMKELAAKADERWNSVPSFLDSPQRQQPAPPFGVTETGKPSNEQLKVGDAPGVKDISIENQEDAARASEKQLKEKHPRGEEGPWQKPKGGWQPESWTPGVVQRR